MKKPTSAMNATTSLNTLIEHYEWMLKVGKLTIDGPGFKRYKQLKERRWQKWNLKRQEYGKSYHPKEPER
tara:strand:- start:1215 stop:1424 length:210 start_codon:yes stop_codon:yes gene_type:complete